jgi:hypothetical protein
MAIYGPSITHKIVYGPQLRFGPYIILWVISRSINCHMALSAMNYLINICMQLSFFPEALYGAHQSFMGIVWNTIYVKMFNTSKVQFRYIYKDQQTIHRTILHTNDFRFVFISQLFVGWIISYSCYFVFVCG